MNDRAFDVALHVYFKDKASHDAYQEHPRHKQFIEEQQDELEAGPRVRLVGRGREVAPWRSGSFSSGVAGCRGEGLRVGTVRRPPRGVPKTEFSTRDFYDVWLPNLSPSEALVPEMLWPRRTSGRGAPSSSDTAPR